jgi:hypothetical protein
VQARTEAEHMRLEVRRLESSLDRKEVQLMELQVSKYARSFVNLLRLCLEPLAVELTQLSRVWPASGSSPKLVPPPPICAAKPKQTQCHPTLQAGTQKVEIDCIPNCMSAKLADCLVCVTVNHMHQQQRCCMPNAIPWAPLWSCS